MWGDPVMARRARELRPLPAHPYRDSAIVYGIMAVILVVLAGATGGSLVRAIGAATIFWVLATAWSWWKFRGRIRELALADAAGTTSPDLESRPGATVSETAGTAQGTVDETGNGNGRAARRAES
jgi:hypothetical protein